MIRMPVSMKLLNVCGCFFLLVFVSLFGQCMVYLLLFLPFVPSATPKGASVPSLGLSNKAVFDEESIPAAAENRHVKDQYPDNYFVSVTMDCKFFEFGSRVFYFVLIFRTFHFWCKVRPPKKP